MKKQSHTLLFFGTFLLIFFSVPYLTARADCVDDQLNQFRDFECRPEKTVYLTFDDGPSIHTRDLLAVLEEKGVPAVFFVMGDSISIVPNSQELLESILDQGHHLGLHSMTHNRDKLYFCPDSPEVFVKEMLELKALLSKMLNGYETNLCRAPFGKNGHFQSRHWTAVEKAGLYCIDWNVDSLDWASSSTDAIYQQVMREYEKEGRPDQLVLLFHEKKETVHIIPAIIDFFHSEGYTFVPYVEGEKIQILN